MLLDLDGDGGAELVVQMVAQPHQFNAVFHYGDGELSCWQYDIMEMSCRDYPLGDGAMVRQYDTGTGPNRYSNLYTVFRYLPDGETEECASLAVHQDTQEDGTEVFTYLVDDAEVDQTPLRRSLRNWWGAGFCLWRTGFRLRSGPAEKRTRPVGH